MRSQGNVAAAAEVMQKFTFGRNGKFGFAVVQGNQCPGCRMVIRADLEAEGTTGDIERVEWIHRHKTGALLAASCELGAIHAGADATVREGMRRYGRALGLAFQITDDVLDETATADALGKTPGKDARSGKATYPALLGLERSREEAAARIDEALRAIEPLGSEAHALGALARYVVTRTT